MIKKSSELVQYNGPIAAFSIKLLANLDQREHENYFDCLMIPTLTIGMNS